MDRTSFGSFADSSQRCPPGQVAVAKKAGVYKGRKPSLTPERVTELRARISAGEKKAALAREFGISRETLYQYAPVSR
jgi:DNA invertase Pin-like site-specific DNA recombinase